MVDDPDMSDNQTAFEFSTDQDNHILSNVVITLKVK